MFRLLISAALATSLAACSSGPRQPRMPEQVINRALANAPGEAQPSRVVAAEIAFSRAARENGQWTAFREYAAPGALIHGRNGTILAEPWLAQQQDPKAAVQWTPLAVWMSCDGRTAISQGKFAEPDGQWGYFVTVWEQQADRSYKWVYDMGAPDPVLTERENRERVSAPDGENEIVVEAIPMIRGDVADCPERGSTPPAATMAFAEGAQAQATASADGTLSWAWGQLADGSRRFQSRLWQGGEWQDALDFAITAEGQVAPR